MTAKIYTQPLPNIEKSCTSCKNYHPDVDNFGYNSRSLSEWFKNASREPSANALRFATCSAFGKDFAHIARKYDCNNGDYWEPKK